MSDNCTSDCSSCSAGCSPKSKENLYEPQDPNNSIKKVIGIVSGKGGVGKSMTTSLLAVSMMKKGYKTAILDADLTGPSIPKCFGIKGKAKGNEVFIFPSESKEGIKIISSNLLLENEDDPVIWRGPIIAGVVKQFWKDVLWEDIDIMFIDMPPGTGDVPLTVFQSIPLDGIILVTTPQDLVSMVVSKAVNMSKKMDIPILGVVENMSYINCPGCDKQIEVFGESKLTQTAKQHDISILGKMPIDPKLSKLCDMGDIEKANTEHLNLATSLIVKMIEE